MFEARGYAQRDRDERKENVAEATEVLKNPDLLQQRNENNTKWYSKMQCVNG